MKYFYDKGIKIYKGINSYYLGNYVEVKDQGFYKLKS